MLWLCARSLWYSVTGGGRRPASAGSPGPPRTPPAPRPRPRRAPAGCRGCCGWPPGRSGIGDGGVVVGQLLPDRQRRLERRPRLGRVPPCRVSRMPRLLWLLARSLLESGDGGVVVGQLLLDRQRRLVRRRAPAASPGLAPQAPRLLWLSARSLWYSVTAGLSSASFRRIASAASYAARASAASPVSRSRMPRLLWLAARSRWYCGDGRGGRRPASAGSPGIPGRRSARPACRRSRRSECPGRSWPRPGGPATRAGCRRRPGGGRAGAEERQRLLQQALAEVSSAGVFFSTGFVGHGVAEPLHRVDRLGLAVLGPVALPVEGRVGLVSRRCRPAAGSSSPAPPPSSPGRAGR